MPPPLMRELGLEAQGLKLAAQALPTVAVRKTRAIWLLVGRARGARERCAGDAAALADWQALLKRFARALYPVLAETPPRLGTMPGATRARSWVWAGASAARASRHARAATHRRQCVHDLLEEAFSLPL